MTGALALMALACGGDKPAPTSPAPINEPEPAAPTLAEPDGEPEPAPPSEPAPTGAPDGANCGQFSDQAGCDAAEGCAWNEAGEFSRCAPSDVAKRCAEVDTAKACGLLRGCAWLDDSCQPR